MKRVPLLTIAILGVLVAGCQIASPTPQPLPPVVSQAQPTASSPAVPRPAVGQPVVVATPLASPIPSIAPTQPLPTLPPTAVPPTATLPPSPTPPPTPTPAPSLRRLTDGECCVSPSWLPDSRHIVFIDRPPAGPVGLYAVDTETGAPPTFWAERLGYYAAGYRLLWQPEGQTIRIESLVDEHVFTLRNGGRTITVSPDGQRVAWQVTPTQTNVPLEQRASQIWVANTDGSDSRQVANLLRGGLSGWFPDGERMLVSGRPDPKSQAVALSVLNLADGSVTELVRAERLRNGNISPGGGWLLYSIAFNPDKTLNGFWLARTDGSERRRLDFYGAIQWRGEGKLIYIPLDMEATNHVLWEYDANSQTSRPLTDANILPFKISNGDWTVSPDGRKVVFVNAQDRNLWVIDLP